MILGKIIYENADDAAYKSLITQNSEQKNVYVEHPAINNEKESTFLYNYMTSSYELGLSYVCYITGISAPILCHTILPVLLLFLVYLAFSFVF